MSRVAVYARVSVDDSADGGGSVDRQVTNCRAFCESREWTIVEVFRDVGSSAFRRQSMRSDFERLLGQLSSGRFGAVVVWKLDRLARRHDDFERFWGECQRNEVAIASVTEPIDTSSGVGVAVMRMLVTFAGLESTVRSDRLKAKNRELASRGVPHSGRPGFGYDRDMKVIETEAAVIREAASRVVKGESITAVARDFAARGLVGRGGRPWQHSSLRQLLLSHRICGERTHLGKVVARDCWEPILDPLAASRMRHSITNSKGSRARRGPGRLLNGLLRCGRCGHGMHYRGKLGCYTCPPKPTGCGGIGIAIRQTEDHITQLVLWRLGTRWPSNRRTPTLRDDQSQRILLEHEWARHRVADINHARFIAGTLSHYEYTHLRHELETELGRRLHSISTYVPTAALPPGFDPHRAEDLWPVLSNAARQAVVELEIDHITVAPATKPARWDPERLRIRFWQSLPASASPSPSGSS